MRSIQRLVFMMLSLIGCLSCYAQIDPKLAHLAVPPTVEGLTSIDGVRIDGTRALSYELGDLQFGTAARFGFHLEHRLVTDLGHSSRSDWDIPELYGVVVPVGRDTLRWRLFGFGDILIPSIPFGPRFHRVGRGFTMQRTAKGDFVFRSESGWEWIYRDWTLTFAHGPAGLQLNFQLQGGKVTEMVATRYRIAAGSLAASYDASGRLQQLQVGNRQHRFAYDDSGQVSVWTADGETSPKVTRFDYAEERVVMISEPGAVPQVLGWTAVPHGQRSDCMWPNAVGVGRTNAFTFEYSHNTRGYVLKALSVTGREWKQVTLNNHKGLAVVTAEGTEPRHIHFGVVRNDPAAGRVIRIDNAAGGTLESYEYDEQGRVQRAWTGELGGVGFTYGSSGALEKTESIQSSKSN